MLADEAAALVMHEDGFDHAECIAASAFDDADAEQTEPTTDPAGDDDENF